MGQVDLDEVNKVVIFLPPTLGDCVNHLTTLRWLRDGLPGREIVAVSSGLGLEILRTWPVEGVELWDRKGLWWKLFRGRFDLGLFPYVQNKMVRVTRFAGLRWLVGVRGGKHDEWFTAGVDRVSGEHQVLDLCRRLFGTVGVECGAADWCMDPLRLTVPGFDVIQLGIMSGASRSDKKWSLVNFREVASRFDKPGFIIKNYGGPDELDALEGIDHMEFADLVIGWRSVADSLANLDVLVTNDTGLMHLAGAVGTPVVGIFMVESPDEYYPPGAGHELLCGDVTVEGVLAAVDRILERQS